MYLRLWIQKQQKDPLLLSLNSVLKKENQANFLKQWSGANLLWLYSIQWNEIHFDHNDDEHVISCWLVRCLANCHLELHRKFKWLLPSIVYFDIIMWDMWMCKMRTFLDKCTRDLSGTKQVLSSNLEPSFLSSASFLGIVCIQNTNCGHIVNITSLLL